MTTPDAFYHYRVEAARMLAACTAPISVTPGIGDVRLVGYAACGQCEGCAPWREVEKQEGMVRTVVARQDAGKPKPLPVVFPTYPPTPRNLTPKCVCGHAARTHNDLGYCQAKGRDKFSNQCDCTSFETPEQEAAQLARKAAALPALT